MRAGFERLYGFLTAPASLLEDPTYKRLRERIAKARAAHQPTKGLQQALSDYVHSCLRSSRTDEQRPATDGGSQ